MKKWITFQLSERGETVLDADPSIIKNVIRKYVKSDIFFPMYFNKSRSYENRIYLFKGYVFIEYNIDESKSYNKIANSSYFIGPLLVNRRLHLTENDEIKKLKSKLLKITVPVVKLGDRVKVLDGKYTNLEAVVTEYYPKDKEVDLSVELKCMSILVPRIPIVCLKNITSEKGTQSTLQEKILIILKEHVSGVTRKEILDLMELTDQETKRLSTCLSRAVKRGLISTHINGEDKSVFVYNVKNT